MNDTLPIVGGDWVSAADAGVFYVGLTISSSAAYNIIGARAVRLLAA